jgi:hypothetical protein
MSSVKQRIAALLLKRDAELSATSNSSKLPDAAVLNGAVNGAETTSHKGNSMVPMSAAKSGSNDVDEFVHASVANSNVSVDLKKNQVDVEQKVGTRAEAAVKVQVAPVAHIEVKAADDADRDADATSQLTQSLEYIVELEEYIQQLEGDRQVMIHELRKYEIEMEERLKSCQTEIAILTDERDALNMRCSLIEGVQKGKAVVDTVCASLKDEIAFLTQERDALTMRCSVFEGIEKEKVALSERCKVLQEDNMILIQERAAVELQRVGLERTQMGNATVDERCKLLEGEIANLTRERDALGLQWAALKKIEEEKVALEQRCKLLEGEIANLTREKDALGLQWAALQEIQEEKVAVDECCKSLQGEIAKLTRERDELGMQLVEYKEIEKENVTLHGLCKSLQDEITFLTQERDALTMRCSLFEGIEKEKVALSERCASLEGEIEMTIQAAVKNEETYRIDFHQRFQNLLRENNASQKLLQDEQMERIRVQTLLSDFEAEYADEMYSKTQEIEALVNEVHKKSQEIEALRSDVDKLFRCNTDLDERNVQLAQLLKSSEEQAHSISSTSLAANEALIVTQSDLRASLESLQKLNGNLTMEKAQLITDKDCLLAELSQLRREKTALLARLDSHYDDLLFLSNVHQDEGRHVEAIDSQPNASTPQAGSEFVPYSNLSSATSIMSPLFSSVPALKSLQVSPGNWTTKSMILCHFIYLGRIYMNALRA